MAIIHIMRVYLCPNSSVLHVGGEFILFYQFLLLFVWVLKVLVKVGKFPPCPEKKFHQASDTSTKASTVYRSPSPLPLHIDNPLQKLGTFILNLVYKYVQIKARVNFLES
jgi:hypothetical protein